MSRCGAAGFSYLVGGRIDLLLCSPYQRDTGAMHREATSDREIDAASATGDDRVFSPEQLLPEYFRHVRSSRIKRGPFAANRKPISGAKTVKVVVVAGCTTIWPVRYSSALFANGELYAAANNMRRWIRKSIFRHSGAGSLATACTAAVNTRDSRGDATESSLMQADRDFAVATHARGIDGWMSFYAPDAIRIRYRDNMVKGFDEIRKFDLPNISDTTSVLNWEPTDAYVFNGGSIGSTTGIFEVRRRNSGNPSFDCLCRCCTTASGMQKSSGSAPRISCSARTRWSVRSLTVTTTKSTSLLRS
jgi:ketosteroid isomerase-like protein